jgi:hypothetical protein
MIGRRRAAALIALALGACATPDAPGTGRWQRPDTTEQQAAQDESYCRSRANAEVDREFRREGALRNEDIATPGSLETMMGRHEARRRAQNLFGDCMRTRGYSRVP